MELEGANATGNAVKNDAALRRGAPANENPEPMPEAGNAEASNHPVRTETSNASAPSSHSNEQGLGGFPLQGGKGKLKRKARKSRKTKRKRRTMKKKRSRGKTRRRR